MRVNASRRNVRASIPTTIACRSKIARSAAVWQPVSRWMLDDRFDSGARGVPSPVHPSPQDRYLLEGDGVRDPLVAELEDRLAGSRAAARAAARSPFGERAPRRLSRLGAGRFALPTLLVAAAAALVLALTYGLGSDSLDSGVAKPIPEIAAEAEDPAQSEARTDRTEESAPLAVESDVGTIPAGTAPSGTNAADAVELGN